MKDMKVPILGQGILENLHGILWISMGPYGTYGLGNRPPESDSHIIFHMNMPFCGCSGTGMTVLPIFAHTHTHVYC